MKLDYEIKPGAIIIEHIDQIIDHDDAVVYHVDLRSKYPGPISWGMSGDRIDIILYVGEDTLKIDGDNADKQTEISFMVPDAHSWIVIADGARYTVRIALYRPTYQTGEADE